MTTETSAGRPQSRPRLRVVWADGYEQEARRWAERLNVEAGPGPADLELAIGEDGPRIVTTHGPGGRASVGWSLDLSRARPGTDPVVRAVRGRRSASGLWVVDATAGLGADAAALWRSGMRVTLIERDRLVGALLEVAVGRLEHQALTAGDGSGLDRFELRIGDAAELLERLEDRPEVIYLDPMYPRLGGGAKRGGAAWLRAWLGEPTAADAEANVRLLALARKVARLRVVVKRPRKAPPLAERPSGAMSGSTTRFDIYAADSGGIAADDES